MMGPGSRRVQLGVGSWWRQSPQLLGLDGRTQHAIGSYTVKTQHPYGSCTRQDPTRNWVLHCAGPEANWGPAPYKTQSYCGSYATPNWVGSCILRTQSAGSNTQLGPAHVRTQHIIYLCIL